MVCSEKSIICTVLFFLSFRILITCAAGNVRRKHLKRRLAPFTQSNGDTTATTGSNLVMSCDINEGDYQQEDAFVLNLRFAESSEEILRSLKKQQQDIANQVKEIYQLFQQTHNEQAKLSQLQNALREQNAQITALCSSAATNEKYTNSIPEFLLDPIDESENEDKSPQKEAKSEKQGPTGGTELPRDRNNQTAATASQDTSKIPAGLLEIEGDKPMSRSIIFGAIDSNHRQDVVSYLGHKDNSNATNSSAYLHEYQETKHDVNHEDTCLRCDDNEYCASSGVTPMCYPCTTCNPGYTETIPCSRYSDVVCEDKNECFIGLSETTCGDIGARCMNTPGGYLCVGGDASCIDDYYFNRRSSQCEPCTHCTSQQQTIVPCSKFSDSICITEDVEQLSDVWAGALRKPNKMLKSMGDAVDGFSLPFTDVSSHNQTVVEVSRGRHRSRDQAPLSSLHRDADKTMRLLQHGIVWMDYNMAMLHSCRSYIQVSLLISTPDQTSSNTGAVFGRTQSRIVSSDPAYQTLAGTRLEHTAGDRYKFLTISAVAEVYPRQDFKVDFRSAHSDCVTDPTKNNRYGIRSIATNSKSGPFSILWLSHDTGAVAFRASVKTRDAFSSLHAEFSLEYASDLHVIQLSSTGRYFEFYADGIVLAKFHQALYSIGESCVEQGYSTVCTAQRKNGEYEEETLVRSHKSGVSYADTAVSLTFATSVKVGDRLSLDVITPQRCQIRYMSDDNIGTVSILWIPQQNSVGLLARLDHHDKIVGSVRAKVLSFVETQNTDINKLSLRSGNNFQFKEAGRVYINYVTRTIHSCDYLKVVLYYVGNANGSPKSEEIAQQVLGNTDGHWDGISVGASHTVEAGSMCYVSLTCTRGRVSEMSYGEWSTLSIVWVPL